MEKKKLYVFVSHAGNNPYAYSLYALDIPSPGTIVIPITTTVTTITTTTINGKLVDTTTDSTSCTEPQRCPVEPVLRFCTSDWPQHMFMNCTRLKSKLYFIGGSTGGRSSEEVYALDLSQEIPSTMRDRSREVLKQVPSMITGKGSPFYTFVADGKIFAVSGPPFEGPDVTQFEIFDPEAGPEGEWTTTRPEHPPPFQAVSYDVCPLVVGRRAFFVASRQKQKNSWGNNVEEFICCYDIDTGTWSDNNCMEGIFGYSPKDLGMGYPPHSVAEVVGETLWKVQPHPETRLPIVVRLDITNNKERKEKKFFDVVKYHNNVKNYSNDEWITRGGILKRLGVGDSPNSIRLCFLEFESSVFLKSMSVTLFDVDCNGDSAEYVASAHYSAELEDCHAVFEVSDANVV